ncbi:MAG: hypothetical protein ABIJ61_12970, partial [bacterium]
AKARAEKRLHGLASAKPDFKSTFVEFQNILSDLQDQTSIPQFLGQVATDKDVRDAGLACDTDISKYGVEIFSREGLYKAMKAAADRGELLEGEDARLMEKTLLDFKRSGLGLPPEQREKLKDLPPMMGKGFRGDCDGSGPQAPRAPRGGGGGGFGRGQR